MSRLGKPTSGGTSSENPCGRIDKSDESNSRNFATYTALVEGYDKMSVVPLSRTANSLIDLVHASPKLIRLGGCIEEKLQH